MNFKEKEGKKRNEKDKCPVSNLELCCKHLKKLHQILEKLEITM